MARYTESVCKLCRREGEKLFLKGERCFTSKCAFERRAYAPGQHGRFSQHRRRRESDYSRQLRAKQKAKRIYGVLEKQFKNYYIAARKESKDTGTRLLQLLESRLDNIVYRLGFAPTRAAARQFVTHGHILVNNKKLNIPSYQVKIGDTISLKPKIQQNPDVKKLITDKKYELPKWLEKKAIVGKLSREPVREELDADIKEQLIVEYYSK